MCMSEKEKFISREIYFKELSHMIVEASKSKNRQSRPAGQRSREALHNKAKGSLLAELSVEGDKSFSQVLQLTA